MLSRRGLIGSLISLTAAPAIVRVDSLMKLAPTEIIKPQIILPSNNVILTTDMIAREAVRLFKNSNSFIRDIDAQYSDLFER